MKRLFCLMMCVVMILSAAACGQKQAEETTVPSETAAETENTVTTEPETTEVETTVPETTEPETTEPETTEPETTAVMTDKNAKPEDVLKAAAEALTAEDIRFAFTAEPVLDLSVFYQEPEQETNQDASEIDMTQLMFAVIAEMLFDKNGELNIRLEPNAVGFYEAGKGVEADIVFKNNLAEKAKKLLTQMMGIESEDDPSIAWIKDEIKTALYVDLTERITFFLNPITGRWNYIETKDDSDPESPAAEEPGLNAKVPEEIDLDQMFEEYEWTVTDDQYVLSGKVNAEELSGTSGAAEQLPEGAALRLTLVFSGEQKLTAAELVMDPFKMDLSGLVPGLSFELKEFKLQGALDYETPESFAVPAEIAANAEKYEGDIPFISGGSDDEDLSGQY